MGRPRTPCLLAPLTLYTFQFYASSATGATPYAADGISFVDGMVTSITSMIPRTTFGMYGCYIECVPFPFLFVPSLFLFFLRGRMLNG